MKIGILISSLPREDKYTGSKRITEASEKMGHKMIKIHEPLLSYVQNRTDSANPPRSPLNLMGEVLEMTTRYDGKELGDFDVIIYRPDFIEEPSLHTYHLTMLKRAGYKILNGSEKDIEISKNKISQHMWFQENEIPVPNWAIARASKDALAAAEEIGFPVILKTAFGTHGTGIFYAENSETLLPIVEYLGVRDRNPIIIEEFVKDADRKDLRVFCVGGEVVAAMERTARAGDVRANSYIGGTARAVELEENEREAVKKLLTVSKLDIVGIDLLRSKRGPLVIEINSNPGFKKLEEVTGVDVAEKIIRAAESKVV